MAPDTSTNQNQPEPINAPTTGPRYILTIAYDGTLFHGWQKQHPPNAQPLRTVAGVVEAAIALALQQPVSLVGASRTDAGVHALGQTAHFNADTRIPTHRLADAINARLPDDVAILDCRKTHPDFDAIAHARAKQYRYRIFLVQGY
jgi:tRNA pseudouridine38-40 synthase